VVRPLLVLGAVLLASTVAPASGFAQFLDFLGRADAVASQPSPQVPEFGTGSESILVIGADSFEMLLGTEFLPNGDNTGRTCQVGLGASFVCVYLATVNLPSGALITGVDLEACDGDPVTGFGFGLAQFGVPVQNGSFVVPPVTSGGLATPGCAVFPMPLTRTVNNAAEKLAIAVDVQVGANLGFTTARVHYKLQVSPAPGTATFGDVPTSHPFFQFVEALAASGITGGCGSGNYCPDNPVTRGQMAVFLSKALGLHFPN
jgi:hypothetical protein